MTWLLPVAALLLALPLIVWALSRLLRSEGALAIPGLALLAVQPRLSRLVVELDELVTSAMSGTVTSEKTDQLLHQIEDVLSRLALLRDQVKNATARGRVERSAVQAKFYRDLVGAASRVNQFDRAKDLAGVDALGELEQLRLDIECDLRDCHEPRARRTLDDLLGRVTTAIDGLKHPDVRRQWQSQCELRTVARLSQQLRRAAGRPLTKATGSPPSIEMWREFRDVREGVARCLDTFEEPRARAALSHLAEGVDRACETLGSPEAEVALAGAEAALSSLREEELVEPARDAPTKERVPTEPVAAGADGGTRREARSSGPEVQMPEALTDRVHFSFTAPRIVAPGTRFVLDIWAHFEQQRADVLERARQHVGGGPIYAQDKGPVRLARGTILRVHVQLTGLVIDEPEDTILWDGEIGNAGFAVQAPEDAPFGACAGTARFYIDALEVARLRFTVSIGRAAPEAEMLPAEMQRYRSAFASYASEDNDVVLNVVQGIQIGMPDLDVFFAEHSLRAGEHWPQRLREEILARDIFYLFWSQAASCSKWVGIEWRFAYENRGIGVIKPVPLVPPHIVPPPPELAAELHFNDWVLAHKRRAQCVH